MKKSISRIIGVIMLILAIVFIMFALNHSEKSFPWNNTITWLLYGVYFLVTVVLPIAPKMKQWEIPVFETEKSEFTEENSNGTVPTDYIYSDFNISNNIICDIHSQENKKALADIVFGRTSSAAYIHRTDDLL